MGMSRTTDEERYDSQEPCGGCTSALQAVIDVDSGDSEVDFEWAFGVLMDDLHDAVSALHRVRRERWTDRHDQIANSQEAADKLVRIRNAINEAIARGREIDID